MVKIGRETIISHYASVRQEHTEIWVVYSDSTSKTYVKCRNYTENLVILMCQELTARK